MELVSLTRSGIHSWCVPHARFPGRTYGFYFLWNMDTEGKTNRELFAEALDLYTSLGYKVIPCVTFYETNQNGEEKRLKKPLVDWKDFQDVGPTAEDIASWKKADFADFAGVEAITGRQNPSLVITGVDFDHKNGRPNFEPYIEDLGETMRTKTASGGYHFYYRNDLEFKNATNIFHGEKDNGDTIVDIRGTGGVIVLGPTPLWSRDPRISGAKPPTLMGRYETSSLFRPEDLAPFPSRFTVALQAKMRIGSEEWKSVFNGKVGDGNRHTVAMSLIAKLLAGVTEPEHVAGARELVYSILKTHFSVDPSDPLERDKIEDMFAWVISKEKKKRSPEYEAMKGKLKAAEEIKSLSAWKDLLRPVRAERRGEVVTFFDEDGKTMSIKSDMYFSQPTFRRCHALEYGVFLPSITAKKFEKTISEIPVKSIIGQSLTLAEIIQEILEGWTTEREASDTDESARQAARRNGYATTTKNGRLVLYFTLKSILPELADEGSRPNRSEINDAMRALGVGNIHTKEGNLWKYDTKPVSDGVSEPDGVAEGTAKESV